MASTKDSCNKARDLGQEVFRLQDMLAESDKKTLHLAEENARLREQVAQLKIVQEILRESVLDAHNRIEEVRNAADIQIDRAAEEARTAILQAQNDARTAILQARKIRDSTSWTLTAPIRMMGRIFPGLAHISRKILLGAAHRNSASSPVIAAAEVSAADFSTINPATPSPAKLDAVARFSLLQSNAGERLFLVAADIPPMFDRESGALRLYTMMRILSESGCRLAFASVASRVDFEALAGSALNRQRYESRLREIGVEKIAYGYEETNALLEAEGNGIRWALLSFPRIAHNLIPRIRFHAPWATIIYDMVDFHFLRINREANLKSDEVIRSFALKFREIELANARTSDVTIAVSEEERQAMLKLDPSVVVKVVPNIFEIPPDCDPELSSRESLLFVGGFRHPPNIDAVRWFANEIWPLIRQQRPDLKFIIAGSAPTQEVLTLAKITNIEVVGYVEDLTPLFRRARVFVAPLRYGAGVKGKVGQSMAQGLPIVATKVAAEGMNAVFGKDLLVADEPAAFAAAVTRLLDDDNLWLQLRANGKKLISQTQSIEAARMKLGNILNG